MKTQVVQLSFITSKLSIAGSIDLSIRHVMNYAVYANIRAVIQSQALFPLEP